MKTYFFPVSIALVVLLAAGCAGAASDEEAPTRQLGSIPMSNATIYQIDGSTPVADTIEGTLYLVPYGFSGTMTVDCPIAGTVAAGKITLELPEMTNAQLQDIGDASITVTPSGTKVFPGALFALVDGGGDIVNSVVYGTIDESTLAMAGFLYSEADSVSITGSVFNIAAAQSGWNIVTFVTSDIADTSYSNNTPLSGNAVWLYGAVR